MAGEPVGTDYGPDHVKRLVLAMQLMTRLPLPALNVDERDFAAAIRWLPATGIAVGLIVAGGAGLGMRIDPWVGALSGLVAWVAVTGALHLDGLGDIADAAGAAHGDRTRLSAVLADPHIGSFGAVAIGLQLLVKLVLLRSWRVSDRYSGRAGCRHFTKGWRAAFAQAGGRNHVSSGRCWRWCRVFGNPPFWRRSH